MSLLAYIGAKPTSASIICLVVAIVMFVLSAFEGFAWRGRTERTFTLVPIGLVFFALAFLLK